MALLKFKRSAVPAKIPSIADIDLGEIAINTYDGKLYTKKQVGITQTIVDVGGGGGTVTSVSGTGTVSGLSLTGSVTTSGNLTLGGTLSGVSLTTQVTGTLPVANGGTGAVTAAAARTALGAYSAANPSGYITSSASITGNAATATALQTSRTIALSGDVTGSVSFNGSANATITATVVDDSHAHIIANVDGLQAALDGKQAAGSYLDTGATTQSKAGALNIGGAVAINGANSNSLTILSSGFPTYATKLQNDYSAGVGTTLSGNGYNILRHGTSAGTRLNFTNGTFTVEYRDVAKLTVSASGPVIASVDMRAPIFYDSANTGYYVDPNATSNLNALQVGGGEVYRTQWGTGFQSGSNFPDGTLVTTDIPADVYTGDSFNIEISGKSYSSSNPQFKVIAGGYLYADTIIATTGMSYAGTFASYIRVFQADGVLKFWWPTMGYWHSFNVVATSMNVPTNGNITRNRVTSIVNSAEPAGTKKVTITLAKSMRADVSATNNVDIRAPIFYDSANTAFYLDPASTSNINGLSGNGKNIFTTSDTYLRFNQTKAFSNGIWMGNSDYGGSSGTLHLGSNGGSTTARVRIIGGTFNGSTVITLNGVDGSIIAAGNITAYSDIRLKEDIRPIADALSKVEQLNGVTYTRNDLADTSRRYGGLIAQDVQKVLPEAVTDNTGTLGVDYNATIGLLVEAIKELKAEIETLKAKG